MRASPSRPETSFSRSRTSDKRILIFCKLVIMAGTPGLIVELLTSETEPRPVRDTPPELERPDPRPDCPMTHY